MWKKNLSTIISFSTIKYYDFFLTAADISRTQWKKTTSSTAFVLFLDFLVLYQIKMNLLKNCITNIKCGNKNTNFFRKYTKICSISFAKYQIPLRRRIVKGALRYVATKGEFPKSADQRKPVISADYRFVYPEFLPDPKIEWRNVVREKLERIDMINRRYAQKVPAFSLA